MAPVVQLTVPRPESRRPGATHVRPDHEGRDVSLRHVRRPNGGHRNRGPARVPRPRAGPHSGQGAGDHAVRRLVCQPPPWHTRHGGDRGGHRAARHRPRVTTGAHRGQPPMGEGPTAALLQQIFEVDPLACPTSRGPMRIIACITRASVIDQILAPLRASATTATHAAARSPSGPSATRRPAAAHRARCASPRRPAHGRGRSACASDPPERRPGPCGDRAPTGNAVRTATEARRRAAGRPLRASRPSRGRRSRRMSDSYSTDAD